MVQIYEDAPSFKSRLAGGLVEGLGKGAQAFAEQFAEREHQKKTADYFSELAEKNPGERNYELLRDIYSSPMGMEDKSKLAKSLIGESDPYRHLQQERLSKDSISKRYNNAIKEIDNAFDKGIYRYGSDEYNQAINVRSQLAAERDELLGFSRRKDSEEMLGEEEGVEEPKKKAKKIKFNPNNPKHKAVRDKILKQTKGDRKKAGEILSRSFEL